jgi:hypothetical protein
MEQTPDGTKLNPGNNNGGVKLYMPNYILKKDKSNEFCFRWKVKGGGGYSKVGPAMSDNRNNSAPVFFTNLTTSVSKSGSIVVTEERWYYTRVTIINGEYEAVTACNTYDNKGGNIIQQESHKINENCNQVAFAIWDCQYADKCSAVLNSYKINKIKDEEVLFFEKFDLKYFNKNEIWNENIVKGCSKSPGMLNIEYDKLHILQKNSGNCLNKTFKETEQNIRVNENTMISFDVKPVSFTPRTGVSDIQDEHPAIAMFTFLNNKGDTLVLKICYNFNGGRDIHKPNLYRKVFGNCVQSQWKTNETFRIYEFFPESTRLIKISLGGSGGDYESYFDNLKIFFKNNVRY